MIIVASLLGIGYGTVNRLQLERDRISAVHAQDALRQENAALVAENARVKKTAQETYASALKLDRSTSQTLSAIQRETAAAGLINQRTLGLAAQATALQSSALEALRRTLQASKVKPR